MLVPGMGDLRAGYRFLAPALRAAGYRVACTDLRGHGDSDATFASRDGRTMIEARHLTKRYGKAVAVDGVSSGRLDPQSAAGLIAGSALGAFQPHHSTPTTTT